MNCEEEIKKNVKGKSNIAKNKIDIDIPQLFPFDKKNIKCFNLKKPHEKQFNANVKNQLLTKL